MTAEESGIAFKAAKPSGLWSGRSRAQKLALGFVGVCGLAAIAAGSVVAVTYNATEETNSASANSAASDPDSGKQGVCSTPECSAAAQTILLAMDQTADPCQDFYRFACGGWIDSHEIPSTASKWGIFYELRDQVDEDIREVSEAPIAGGDSQSVMNLKNLYTACMDEPAIESAGLSALLSTVYGDAFGGWPMIQNNWDGANFSWEALAGSNIRDFLAGSFFLVYAYLDNFDTSRNILYIDQPSFALPRDFYVDPESYAEPVAAYKQYIVDVARVMTREAGENVPDSVLVQRAEDIFTLEKTFAGKSVPADERRDAFEMYNPFTFAQLKQMYPFDWDTYLGAVFADTNVQIADSETAILVEPEYFYWLEPLLIATPEDILADYLYFRRIINLVPEGTQELRDIQFAFEQVLYGAAEPKPRWSTCSAKTASETKGFGYAVGAEWVRANFNDQTKNEADALVSNLRESFKEIVQTRDWMDDETKVVATEKADLMEQLVGYPDWILDNAQLDAYYAGVRPTDPATHFDNIRGVMSFAVQKGMNVLRETPDRTEWITPPAIVNAFYSPQHNSISFPGGILQPPFFGGGYPRYLNYGAIGVVMGHEITHGFDDNGRQYDGLGNVNLWWNDQTIANFEAKAQCYIDQYNNYFLPEIGSDVHVNGVLTQGENIADNGGVHEAINAYRASVVTEGVEDLLPGLTAYNQEQMFFISYAQVWCEKSTNAALENQILTDPHSPGRFRVQGPLSNSQDFVDAFSCPAGSPYNRENKCDLW